MIRLRANPCAVWRRWRANRAAWQAARWSCNESPDGQHEVREVCGVGAAGFECRDECVHCGALL